MGSLEPPLNLPLALTTTAVWFRFPAEYRFLSIWNIDNIIVAFLLAGDLLASSPTSLESCDKVKEQIGVSPSEKVKSCIAGIL